MGYAYTLFPSLTQDLLDHIRFQGNEYRFFYSTADSDQELESNVMDSGSSNQTYSLNDPAAIWSPDTHNWGFERSFRLSPKFLFGISGVAPVGAKLGVAILWVSTTSKQRGIIPIGQFDSEENLAHLHASYRFSISQLRGRVEISTLLYLAEAAKKIDPNELHLANTAGIVLGEIEKTYIILDGTASTFPIVEVFEPVQPLWYISCEWDNPLIELFNDTVRLNLNKAHKDFSRVDQASVAYDPKFVQEIMASALTIFIMKLRTGEYWQEIDSGVDFEHGSVAEAAYYFVNTLKWQTSTPEATSVSIRKYFDRMIA